MEVNEKMRDSLSKQRKKTVDMENKRTTVVKKKDKEQKNKDERQISLQFEEPFYERLRREDNELNEKKKQEDIQYRAKLAHQAAYSGDGKCLLDLTT